MAEKFNEKVFDARLYLDRSTRILHLSAVLALVIYYVQGVLIENDWLFWIVITYAAAYDVVPYSTERLTFLIRSRPSMLLHYIFFFLIAVYIIPVGHPLELLGFAIMAVGCYWLGTEGFLLSFVALSGAYISAAATQNVLDSDSLPTVLSKILMLSVMGGLITRYTVKDRIERGKLEIATDEVRYERKRLQSLINSMADAVISTDDDGKVELYNGAALILLNTNTSIGGMPLKKYLKFVDEQGQHIDLIEQAQNEDRIIQRDDLRFKNNEDEFINIYVDLAPIRTYGEKGEGFILLLRDITKEKTIEEQRDDFISIVSHELRTPIAITEGNISTAMLPALKDENKRMEMLKQAHDNVLFLADLVNDITTLAHAERGDLDSVLESAKPKEIIDELYANYKDEANNKGLELKLDVASHLPEIKTNKHRLKEILQDFATNAIKYTEKGDVTLSVHTHGKTRVRFAIKDSGIGISTSDRKHVFDKFYRSEDYRTRSHSGTGLGLYIAKKLAELIGAQVGVDSKLNQGSTFYVDVPRVKKRTTK